MFNVSLLKSWLHIDIEDIVAPTEITMSGIIASTWLGLIILRAIVVLMIATVRHLIGQNNSIILLGFNHQWFVAINDARPHTSEFGLQRISITEPMQR